MNGSEGFASNVRWWMPAIWLSRSTLCMGKWKDVFFSIMQWLCNPWNIGYILVPLQRKSLKENFCLWSDRKWGEEWARLWEQWRYSGRKYDGIHTAFFFFFSKPQATENCQLSLQSKSPKLTKGKVVQMVLNSTGCSPPLKHHTALHPSVNEKSLALRQNTGARAEVWIENQALMRMNLLIWHI